MNFIRSKSWLRDIFLWAYEARLAFLCFIVLLLAFLFGFYMWPSEQSIRTSGFGLQIIGMVFAIRGLLKIRAHFGQPTLRRLSKAWLYRFPKWKKDTVIDVVAGDVVMVGEIARVELWAPDNPEDSLEKRINGVIRNVERLKAEQNKNSDQITELQKNQEKHQKEQEHARVNMENQIRSDLESLHTNDIVLSLVGLVWVIFGIFMSTMSQELSKVFQ
jgi:hypothetical protein